MRNLDDALRCRHWAVGNVETGEEPKVAQRLKNDGLEVYLPLFEKPVRRRQWHKPRRKRETVEKAVFPGYLFVDTDSITNMEAVYETPGFHYFLRNSGNLSLLPGLVIDGLRALEGRGVLVATSIRELTSQFFAGDRVRVGAGIFEGYTGWIESQDRDRVIVAGGDFTFPIELAAEDLKLEDAGS